MSVQKDPSGRRYVQAEVEVPGSVEEVWEAIATGPGVSSWFVPCEGGGEVGETVTTHFGPGMDSTAKVTEWEPLKRFAAESGDLGPNAPTLGTEWSVEAKDGGTCIVRVVHSLFADTDDWDNQLNGIEAGWPAFFRILRLYLAHFRGQRGAMFRVMGMTGQPEPEAWKNLMTALRLEDGQPGDHREGVRLAGTLEEAAGAGHPHQVLMRIDRPGPGLAHIFSMPMGGMALLCISLYLYGDDPSSLVAEQEPEWQNWMSSVFPPADGGGTC